MAFVPIKECKTYNVDSLLNIESLLLFSNYYKKYYGEKFEDLSFYAVDESFIQATILCYRIENEICWPSDGCYIYYLNQNPTKELTTRIIKHLEEMAATYTCKSLIIRDTLVNGELSQLGNQLFKEKYVSRLSFDMRISYKGFNTQDFHKKVRKSYKSLLNWGDKNLGYLYINKNNQDLDAFNDFKSFHHKIAGRQTRSDETWQTQYELIKQGYGELVLGYYNNQLSAGSLFADYGDVSMYFTGVYERDLFQFGISHSLLYKGICRSYERGNTSSFSLGLFDTDIQDPKWYNIQFFKKGFCNNLTPVILWKK